MLGVCNQRKMTGMADYQEAFAEMRAGMADRRDQAADERDRVADERDRVADERDRIADERDRLADERETRADRRERTANQRETHLDERQAHLDRATGAPLTKLQERVMAAISGPRERAAMAVAALARIEASRQRDAAAHRRYDAARRRTAAKAARENIKLGSELTYTMHDLRRQQQQTAARSQDAITRSHSLRSRDLDTGPDTEAGQLALIQLAELCGVHAGAACGAARVGR